MLKKIVLSILFLTSVGMLFSFQDSSSSLTKVTKTIHPISQRNLLAEERPRIKIRIQVGLPDLLNICSGDNPCGACPGLCIKIIFGSVADDLSSYGGVEFFGESEDSTHFVLTYNNSSNSLIKNGSTVTLSEDILLDGVLINDTFGVSSITLLHDAYTPVDNGDGTSSITVNCL